jgi:hypothetical protein
VPAPTEEWVLRSHRGCLRKAAALILGWRIPEFDGTKGGDVEWTRKGLEGFLVSDYIHPFPRVERCCVRIYQKTSKTRR